MKKLNVTRKYRARRTQPYKNRPELPTFRSSKRRVRWMQKKRAIKKMIEKIGRANFREKRNNSLPRQRHVLEGLKPVAPSRVVYMPPFLTFTSRHMRVFGWCYIEKPRFRAHVYSMHTGSQTVRPRTMRLHTSTRGIGTNSRGKVSSENWCQKGYWSFPLPGRVGW